jgi:ketosteroid isomerase-like protein
MPRNSLESFVEAYGKAISSSDLEGVADSWEVPALVLSDEGTTVVNAKEEVTGFFEKAPPPTRARGAPQPSARSSASST